MPYHIILGYSFICCYISYKFLEIEMEGVGVEEGERKEEREGGRSIYSFNYKKNKEFHYFK